MESLLAEEDWKPSLYKHTKFTDLPTYSRGIIQILQAELNNSPSKQKLPARPTPIYKPFSKVEQPPQEQAVRQLLNSLKKDAPKKSGYDVGRLYQNFNLRVKSANSQFSHKPYINKKSDKIIERKKKLHSPCNLIYFIGTIDKINAQQRVIEPSIININTQTVKQQGGVFSSFERRNQAWQNVARLKKTKLAEQLFNATQIKQTPKKSKSRRRVEQDCGLREGRLQMSEYVSSEQYNVNLVSEQAATGPQLLRKSRIVRGAS